jgi:geranylgeranyl diphosphate synthase type I
VAEPYPVDEFVAQALLERDTHLAAIVRTLAKYGFPALLGFAGINRARQGSTNALTKLIGVSYLAHGGAEAPGAMTTRQTALVATAQEMFRDASLVHDDLMDKSDTRRGRPSLHRHLEDLHRESDWLGDSAEMGVSLALMIGDAMLIMADTLIGKALGSLEAPQATYMLDLHHSTRIEQVLGQAMDTIYPYLPDLEDPEEVIQQALATVQAKSARYMAGTPLALGAAAAGADRGECDVMMQVGVRLGEAFQLRDDVQGAIGDAAAAGKPVGQDLIDGKRTVLIGLTMRLLPPSERRAFMGALLRGNAPPVEARVQHMQTVIRQSGAVDQVEAMIEGRRTQAFEILQTSSLDPVGQEAIRQMGDWLLTPARI